MVPLSIGVALLAAGLTFLVEPLIGKLLLPFYGGASSVWTTCLVIFQLALLVGYLVTHLAVRWLGYRRAAILQVAIIVMPVLALPIGLRSSPAPPPEADPTLWLGGVLVLVIGAPFVALTMATPTLQTWLAAGGGPSARTGAFRLFAAGSGGSLVGLLAYPLVVERALDVVDQAGWWSVGYLAYAILMAAGAIVVLRRGRSVPARMYEGPASPATTTRDRLGWVAFAAIPAALVVGTTAHLSVDVAAVPLLWVIPLGVYLGTFILAFAGPRPIGRRLGDAALPVLALLAILTLFDTGDLPLELVFVVQLGALAAAGLACHGRLVLARPGPDDLTAYDLAIATGGAVGGVLAGLVGPLILPVPLEGAIALLLALAVRARPIGPSTSAGPDPGSAAAVDVLRVLRRVPLVLRYALAAIGLVVGLAFVGARLPTGLVVGGLLVGFLLVLAGRPRVFAAAAAGLVLISVAALPPTLDTVRTFYGVHRVAADAAGRHALFAGTTIQGMQRYLPPDLRDRPIGYYHPGGPIADVMTVVEARAASTRTGVVGLGAGALAAYGRSTDSIDFFEIDPAVVGIARDPALFTYLVDSPARIDVKVGDGRLAIAAEPPDRYDLIAIDAFASDAIPVHLLTREALAVYLERLRPGGLITFNVSNRYVALEPVLAAAARDLGLAGIARVDDPPLERAGDADPSQWVVLAKDPGDLDRLAARPGWRPLVTPAARAWTDRYSDLFGAMFGR